MSDGRSAITMSRRRPQRPKALGMGSRAFAFASKGGSGDSGFPLPDLPVGQFFLVDGNGAYLLDTNNNFLTASA